MEFDHRLVNLEQLRQSIYPDAISNCDALHDRDRQNPNNCRICGLKLFLHPSTLQDMRWNDELPPDGFLRGINFLCDFDNLDSGMSEEVDLFEIHDHCSKGMIYI